MVDLRMEAIILNEPGNLEYKEISYNLTLRQGEALLKVHRIGICGTDLHAFKGDQPFFSYPRILGHELGVEVVGIGEGVANVKIGDKCSVEPYFNYHSDQTVKRGKTNCGESLSVFGVHEDGGMREFIKIPSRYLHKSNKLSFDQLALVEPLGIGCHAVNRAEIKEGEKVLVIGAGPIGLATLQFAKIKKAKVVMMDLDQERLNFCKLHLHVEGIVNTTLDQVIQELREAFDGDLPTVVMDATGNPQSMKKTFDYVAFGGKIVFIGLYQGNFTFFDPLFHKKEITLMASRNALSEDFKQIIGLLEDGVLETNHWITHRVSFKNLPAEFESFLNPASGVIKAMVEF